MKGNTQFRITGIVSPSFDARSKISKSRNFTKGNGSKNVSSTFLAGRLNVGGGRKFGQVADARNRIMRVIDARANINKKNGQTERRTGQTKSFQGVSLKNSVVDARVTLSKRLDGKTQGKPFRLGREFKKETFKNSLPTRQATGAGHLDNPLETTYNSNKMTRPKNRVEVKLFDESDEDFASEDVACEDESFDDNAMDIDDEHYDNFTFQKPFSRARLPAASNSSNVISPLQGVKVSVRNLHPGVTEDDIIELFGSVGALKKVSHHPTLRSAEVVFVDAKSANEAVQKYHLRELDEQPMYVTLASHPHKQSKAMNLISGRLAPAVGQISQQSKQLPETESSPINPTFFHEALFQSKSGSSDGPVRFTVNL